MTQKSDPIPVPINQHQLPVNRYQLTGNQHQLYTDTNDIIVVLPEMYSIKLLDSYDSSTPAMTPPPDLMSTRVNAPLPSYHTPPANSIPSPFNQIPLSPVMCHCAWSSQPRGPTGLHCGAFYSKYDAGRQQTKLISDLMKQQLDLESQLISPSGSLSGKHCPQLANSLDTVVSM